MEIKELEVLQRQYRELMVKLNDYNQAAFDWITEGFGNLAHKERLQSIRDEHLEMIKRLNTLSDAEFEIGKRSITARLQ